VVSLTATGGTAWYFTGWSGAVTSLLPITSVTMSANKSVTANFIAGVNITVSKQGQFAFGESTTHLRRIFEPRPGEAGFGGYFTFR
jgi:hypothetical protein